MTLKNNRAPLLCCFKLFASFHSRRWIQTKVTVRKRSIQVKISDLLSRVAFKFDGWPWKTLGHLFHFGSSFMHHFITIGELKLKLQSGNAQFGSKSAIFVPYDLEIWRMTLKNNREPLLSTIKIYASNYHHVWIPTGVTVRKRLSWVMTSVTLTFDLWPWPFAWTSLLSLVITPENFVAIRWQEHSEKVVTDRQTDRRTERGVLRAAWSQLKIAWNGIRSSDIFVPPIWCSLFYNPSNREWSERSSHVLIYGGYRIATPGECFKSAKSTTLLK